jgi:ankyrin repeat protein
VAKAPSAQHTRELFEALSGWDAARAVAAIGAGAKVNGRDEEKRTPLYLAAKNGLLEPVRLLLERGAKVDARFEDEWTSETPLHVAARAGHREIVELLLKHHAEVDALNRQDTTALHIAAAGGQREVAAALLDGGADLHGRGWLLKSTPLHVAAEHGSVAVVELLLERGAAIDDRRQDGRTPLHRALENAHPNVAELLVARGADVNARDVDDWTPLHVAVARGLTTASLLLERGADVQARARGVVGMRRGYRDATALHIAAAYGKPEMAELLFQRDRQLLGACDAWGKTPLHAAAENGHGECAERLLRLGADAGAADKEGKTPMERAQEMGDQAIVALFGGSPKP